MSNQPKHRCKVTREPLKHAYSNNTYYQWFVRCTVLNCFDGDYFWHWPNAVEWGNAHYAIPRKGAIT